MLFHSGHKIYRFRSWCCSYLFDLTTPKELVYSPNYAAFVLSSARFCRVSSPGFLPSLCVIQTRDRFRWNIRSEDKEVPKHATVPHLSTPCRPWLCYDSLLPSEISAIFLPSKDLVSGEIKWENGIGIDRLSAYNLVF